MNALDIAGGVKNSDLSIREIEALINLYAESKALAAWVERAKRDKTLYQNEESAFSFYWKTMN